MDSFNEKLKNHILKNGYTTYRISKLSGVERTGLQRCLSGQRLLPKEAIYKLIELLHLDYKEQADLLNSYTIEQIGEHRYRQWEYIRRIIESLSQLFQPLPIPVTLEKEVRLCEHLDPYTLLHGRYAIIRTIQTLMEYGIYECEKPEINLFLPDDRDLLSSIIPIPYASAAKPVFNQLIQLAKTNDSAADEHYNLKILDTLLPFGLSVCMDYNIYYNYMDIIPQFFNNIIFPYYIIINESTIVLISDNIQTAAICQIPEQIRYYKQTFLSYLGKTQKLMTIYADTAPHLTHFIEIGNLSQKLFFLGYQPCFFTYTSSEMIERYVNPDLENREYFLEVAHGRLKQLRAAASSHSVFSQRGLEFFVETGIMTDMPSGIATAILPKDRLLILKRLRKAFEQEDHTFRMIDSNYFQFPDYITISVSADFGIDFFIYDEGYQSRYLHITETTLSNAFSDFISGISNTSLVYNKEKTFEILDHYLEVLGSTP